MTDIDRGAPEAHSVALTQRLHVTSLPPITTRHPQAGHCFSPGIAPALLSRPESHSP
jgi:hypothetical protein